MALYPWLEQHYQQLTATFSNGRGYHALLFKSDVGLGTEKLIAQFAAWLLCQTPKQDLACDQCKSCLLLKNGNHPDLHILESIDGKDIGIEQIRETNTKLQNFAQQGGNTVVYIKTAECLTAASGNALLKTLEEPNDKVYFLLAAPQQTAILPTIASRCQTWLIHSPEMALTLTWLQAQAPTATREACEIAMRLCHQRPLICKTFLEKDRLTARKTFLRTFWRFFNNRDVFLLFSQFDKEKALILEQLEWLESFFSDSIKAKLAITNGWINYDLHNGILQFSQQLDIKRLLIGHQLIQQTKWDLLAVNAINQELILLACLTKLTLNVFE
ncbi:DNA polymerase III subunit delta' [[Haemophilus] ducreyi]|uniref:DNA polymerase III subunit delta' n=1 Tax=Haemophilus ducreyi TaxID=730 RepID=UPI0006550C74|nr:DNA polymerase III subunit delta' [[Haemophilus] ducreyi]AKO45971.1 DNA polymerase III subunit delta' [[Haemophilus] ducreyi]AKO47329.1 DNA polymerase III subunit delta' [[Haemophilus] ducreyi]AKO48696.1 DNA polymerase III subunit delta' [[Haemophilus] ducreyi]AKO50068.1 DNA polymerase III subunit delta' [[Haemophilus] ducreyi]OOS02867.1 DNA polymerase III subunit delta' [[Haemophilus] ducreyi]